MVSFFKSAAIGAGCFVATAASVTGAVYFFGRLIRDNIQLENCCLFDAYSAIKFNSSECEGLFNSTVRRMSCDSISSIENVDYYTAAALAITSIGLVAVTVDACYKLASKACSRRQEQALLNLEI